MIFFIDDQTAVMRWIMFKFLSQIITYVSIKHEMVHIAQIK